MTKKTLFLLYILSLLVLTGCTKPTSVIFVVKEGDLEISGFARGQTWFGMQCIACPHIGAKIEIKTLDNQSICNGANEVIVGDTQRSHLRVKCKGLELFEGQIVKITGEGFTGGKIEEIKEFKFDEQRVVEFEKV